MHMSAGKKKRYIWIGNIQVEKKRIDRKSKMIRCTGGIRTAFVLPLLSSLFGAGNISMMETTRKEEEREREKKTNN
jgi:hypothetical protein